MKHDKVWITRENMERLRCLLDSRKNAGDRDRAHLEILAQKLDSARVVTFDRIPHDVVTMNSRVRVHHLDAGQARIYNLVLPGSANVSKGNVSVLAPIGTALLGHRAGALIDCDVPGGRKRLRVEEILHQPEAARTNELDANRIDPISYSQAA